MVKIRRFLKYLSRHLFRNSYIQYLQYELPSILGWTSLDTGEINAKYVDDFININTKYWYPIPSHQRDVRILVEGHLSQYGPNYLLRTAVAAKAAEAKLDAEIVVVFNGFRYQWGASFKIYSSFGIRKYIYLDAYFLFRNKMFKILSYLKAKMIFKDLHSVDDILKITYNGVMIGDLIYDDILKAEQIYTMTEIEAKYVVYIRRAIYFFLQYNTLFKLSRYTCLIATHTAYSEYGLLVRVALAHGVKVFETTDIQFSFFDSISDDNLPTYHQGIMNYITAHWSENWHNPELLSIKTANQMEQLSNRMSGEIQQLDAILAYADKKKYSKKDLLDVLGIDENKPSVFIMTHIFVDSPHTSSWMLYKDYYDWLINTFDIIGGLHNANWIIKPHPSSRIYNEEGEVKRLLHKYCPKHVFITPDDFSTHSLLECASAIVTVQGTAGLEFSCYGIPAVITGKAFYSGLGFTIEPKTVEEYKNVLTSIHQLPGLSQEQMLKARLAYALFNENFSWENPIINSEVLDNVWGNFSGRNINKAYEITIENLFQNNPCNLPVYQSVINSL